MIELVDVDAVKGDTAVLQEITWTVRAGERWVVLGGNGAGKTSLLQLLIGDALPSAGRLSVLGEVDPDEVRDRIGLASLSVAEQVPAGECVLDVVVTAAYGVIGRGREEYDLVDESRAVRLLTQLGCRALVDREFRTLSEGERKRVQIARSLMADPELLLLDEPAAGLDLGAREALSRRLTALAAGASSPVLVLVTHHVEEIPAGFTHVLLLRAGRVVGLGPLPEVLTAENLSACFGFPLTISELGGRWAARAR